MKKENAINDQLYLIAVVLVIVWAVFFFATNAGSIIHILLVFALIVVLLRVIKGKDPLG